jgi:hypothetical protein
MIADQISAFALFGNGDVVSRKEQLIQELDLLEMGTKNLILKSQQDRYFPTALSEELKSLRIQLGLFN